MQYTSSRGARVHCGDERGKKSGELNGLEAAIILTVDTRAVHHCKQLLPAHGGGLRSVEDGVEVEASSVVPSAAYAEHVMELPIAVAFTQ